MSMEYIRKTYSVPAKRGMRVEYQGLSGRIIGSRNTLLRVRLSHDYFTRLIHPTDPVLVYVPAVQEKGVTP